MATESDRAANAWPTLPQAQDHDLIRSLSPSSAATGTPAVSTDYRALSQCCRDAASAAFGRNCRRDESRSSKLHPRSRCGSTQQPTKRSPASRGLHMVGAVVRQNGAFNPGVDGSRTRDSQVMSLMLYPVELPQSRRSLRQNPIAEHDRPTTRGRAGRAAGPTASAKT